MSSVAAAERALLCDLFDDVGPDAPTLCVGWTTRDLAAHLVVRDRRPDALPGIALSFLHDYSERVRRTEAERPWSELVERVRTGPPVWNPTHFDPVDNLVNGVEYFVHHEDVRRAQQDWTVRDLDPALEDTMASAMSRMGGLLTRKAGVGLIVEPAGRPAMTLRGSDRSVTIRGPIGECVLYLLGRKDVADVAVDGPADAVEQVRAARFGF
jgi:uncharacterized protein (TIGR03085 family)